MVGNLIHEHCTCVCVCGYVRVCVCVSCYGRVRLIIIFSNVNDDYFMCTFLHYYTTLLDVEFYVDIMTGENLLSI